mgnify:CR=1 FL=1
MRKKIRIKEDEVLHAKLKSITHQLHTTLPSIVQETHIYTEGQLEMFIDKHYTLLDELDEVFQETMAYIEKGR